jgi:hypothetical protein
MSWDVLIFNFGDVPLPKFEDLPALTPLPLGFPAEVRERISAQLPGVDWSDPSWGLYEHKSLAIEFNIGDDDPVQSMMLHVRGGGDPFPAIIAITRANGWFACDTSLGEMIDPDNPSTEGWEEFHTLRDKIIIGSE